MFLGRVIGRVVATRRYPGTEGVPFQWVQPLDETGRREGALACPEPFVPVDAAILGFVEEASSGGLSIGEDT